MRSVTKYSSTQVECRMNIEYEIIGEGSQILTNQKRVKHCFLASDWSKFETLPR